MDIINNEYNLNDSDINKFSKKARILIENSKGEILMCKYADIYMLPGGKNDENETIEEGLKREIKEEIGIDLSSFSEFINYTYYEKDYPYDDTLFNRKLVTYYYKVNMDFSLNNLNKYLTEREKKNCFEIMWVDKKDIINLVINHNSSNKKDNFFKQELIDILNNYINNNKYIDMHSHSIYSDGQLEIDELISLAIKNNIRVLSITDHDTLLGNKNISDYYRKNQDIMIINGIELSAKVDKGRMHILGYDYDINNYELNKKMDELKVNSIYAIIACINQIRIDYNIVFSEDEIKEIINRKGNIGRPLVAKLLVKYGYVNSVKEAFDKYLNPSYSKTRKTNKGISFEECIRLIKDANGLSVLAHPNQLLMDDNELESTLKKLISCGLDGIEVYHSGHSKEEVEKYLDLANKYNLLISGGSDFHGKDVKPNIELGSGYNNNIKIKKLSLVDEIIKRKVH